MQARVQNDGEYSEPFPMTNGVRQGGSRSSGVLVMANFKYPPRFITMVRQFHDYMQTRVQNDGEYSEPFPVTNGVKQDCVMAPTLYSMMFSAKLTDVFSGL